MTKFIVWIVLESLCPIKQTFKSFLDRRIAHNILLTILDNFLTIKLKIKDQSESSIASCTHILATLYNQANSDDPTIAGSSSSKLENVINAFFSHLYVLETDLNHPYLLKYNNRIFITMDTIPFSPDCLSTITEQEYPLIFEMLRKDPIHEFSRHLITRYDGTQYLSVPEIPYQINRQFYHLYCYLLEEFNLLSFETEPEKKYANQVFDYLTQCRDFFDVKS